MHRRAAANYRRNTWARHWLEEFLRERDRDRAFARHLLFTKALDRRAFAWARKRVDEVWDDLPRAWQVHWSLAWPVVERAVEERDKAWKDTLFGTRIPSHVQWPWR